MIKDYEKFTAHLKQTGRMKLLPRVLSELREAEARAKKFVGRRETSAENPALISGWREIKGGMLTDHSGKSALINIYKKITA